MEVAYFAGGCILGIVYALLAVTVAVYVGKKGEKPIKVDCTSGIYEQRWVNKTTAQEAIKELNYDETAYGGKCTKPVREVTIEALEKQIPQRPDLEADGYADGQLVYDTWICPCCEKHYEVDYDDYDFCPNCGQAIDWSKEDADIVEI